MVISIFLSFIYLNLFLVPLEREKIFQVEHSLESDNLLPYLEVLEDESNEISQILNEDRFYPLQDFKINPKAPVHWLRFRLHNTSSETLNLKLSVTFSDDVLFFTYDGQEVKNLQLSGDLTPVSKRSVPIGQYVMLNLDLPENSKQTCYLRIESRSNISQEFRQMALNSFTLYSEATFSQRYEKNRHYQAMFFGALNIMLLYNFIIFLSLRDKSYLFYTFFTITIILFFSSGLGYLAETILEDAPRADLYIRMLAGPLMMIGFTLFSQSYLQYTNAISRYRIATHCILGYFVITIIVMWAGYWQFGRSMVLTGSIVTFLVILYITIVNIIKGYTPAKYFLVANSMLIIGGIIFALQRYTMVVQNPFSQYIIQIAAVLEVAIFSLGLAHRIHLTRRALDLKMLENEKLEKEKEMERAKFIEEKNKELEIKVKERTAEIIEQKEEIETQKDSLELNNLKLQQAQEIINNQNAKLKNANKHLENTVKERTHELEHTNHNLKKVNQELDHFIYRTAHDIRGPLARLMGLCNVAVLDVKDQVALNYFSRLSLNANNLSSILKRLTIIHEIKSMGLHPEPIDFPQMIEEILVEIRYLNEKPGTDYRLKVDNKTHFLSDRNLIYIILKNLLENAKKFQDPFSKELPYIAVEVTKNLKGIRINVSDNGQGINLKEHVDLFQMFSPGAGHDTPGLGLYIVKLCVEKLNGKVELKRKKYPLTEFEISLPD